MTKRRQVIEIYAPTLGRKHDAPSTLIDYRAQPDGNNGKMAYGINRKDNGTSLYATGAASAVGAPVTQMYEAKFPASNMLQLFTATGVYKYTAGTDSFVSDGQTFTGTDTDWWNGVVHNDVFMYCNGVDPIQIKDSVSHTGTNLASAINTNTYKAYALGSVRDHLCLYRTIENGTECPKRVRWSKKGVLTYSAGSTDFNSGTAGAQDVQECEGEIKTAVPLGIAQAIYCDKSIIIQTWVGGTEVYRFTKTISGIGTPSRRGAASFGDANFFVGWDNFYQYMGGSDIRPIGDPVKDFAYGEINNTAMGCSFVEIDDKQGEVLFHVPTNTATSPNVVWVYRLENESWTRKEEDYTSAGKSTRKTGLTIGELVGEIGAQNVTFGSYYTRVESEVRLYGDTSGRVVKVDPAVWSLSYSGTSVAREFSYVTPDIVGLPIGGQITDPFDKDVINYTTTEKRWEQLNLRLKGYGTAKIEYSKDGGSTYTEFRESPVTLYPSGYTHVLDIDESSRMIRFRVSNAGLNEWVGVEYAKVEFVPGSENVWE